MNVAPSLAGAYFLRGWAAFLIDPRNPAALADVSRAAELEARDVLFSRGRDYLKSR